MVSNGISVDGCFNGGGDEEGVSAILFPGVKGVWAAHEGFVINCVVVLGRRSVEGSVEANEFHELALGVLGKVNR